MRPATPSCMRHEDIAAHASIRLLQAELQCWARRARASPPTCTRYINRSHLRRAKIAGTKIQSSDACLPFRSSIGTFFGDPIVARGSGQPIICDVAASGVKRPRSAGEVFGVAYRSVEHSVSPAAPMANTAAAPSPHWCASTRILSHSALSEKQVPGWRNRALPRP